MKIIIRAFVALLMAVGLMSLATSPASAYSTTPDCETNRHYEAGYNVKTCVVFNYGNDLVYPNVYVSSVTISTNYCNNAIFNNTADAYGDPAYFNVVGGGAYKNLGYPSCNTTVAVGKSIRNGATAQVYLKARFAFNPDSTDVYTRTLYHR